MNQDNIPSELNIYLKYIESKYPKNQIRCDVIDNPNPRLYTNIYDIYDGWEKIMTINILEQKIQSIILYYTQTHSPIENKIYNYLIFNIEDNKYKIIIYDEYSISKFFNLVKKYIPPDIKIYMQFYNITVDLDKLKSYIPKQGNDLEYLDLSGPDFVSGKQSFIVEKKYKPDICIV